LWNDDEDAPLLGVSSAESARGAWVYECTLQYKNKKEHAFARFPKCEECSRKTVTEPVEGIMRLAVGEYTAYPDIIADGLYPQDSERLRAATASDYCP
jgi:hypothetical protein